jgi:hypothetical protein
MATSEIQNSEVTIDLMRAIVADCAAGAKGGEIELRSRVRCRNVFGSREVISLTWG